MKGRARVFGHDLTLDEIHPSEYFSLDKEKLLKGLMEGVEPGFYRSVEEGDIIVAGRYFGMGSGRESGAWAIKLSGIKCVIAESFSRYMFRNCINNGIWPIKIEGILDQVEEGDKIEVQPEKGQIILETGKELEFETFPDWVVDMIRSNDVTGI